MYTTFTAHELEAHRRGLSLELAHVDARQLLDIGLVRGEDGSLRLAEDPSRLVAPSLPRQAGNALAALARWIRGLPLRSPNWHPHFFLRE